MKKNIKIKDLFRWYYLGTKTLFQIIYIIIRSFITGVICFINPSIGKDLKYKNKPVIPRLALGLSLSVYFICIFISSKWYVQKLKIDYLSADIASATKVMETREEEVISEEEYTPSDFDEYPEVSFMSVDFTELLKTNKDTVGWIKVNNTKVNYSIVQTTNNSYYLKHDFNKKYNIAGWVFGDFRDNFQYFGNNTIIYAHNMNNQTMFSTLNLTLKKTWYENTDNHFIKISTPYTNTIWKIFSIYTIEPETYYIETVFDTEEDHQKFLNTIKDRSIYNFNEELTTDDKILTLSTCTNNGKKRIVIHSKMVKVEYR